MSIMRTIGLVCGAGGLAVVFVGAVLRTARLGDPALHEAVHSLGLVAMLGGFLAMLVAGQLRRKGNGGAGRPPRRAAQAATRQTAKNLMIAGSVFGAGGLATCIALGRVLESPPFAYYLLVGAALAGWLAFLAGALSYLTSIFRSAGSHAEGNASEDFS